MNEWKRVFLSPGRLGLLLLTALLCLGIFTLTLLDDANFGAARRMATSSAYASGLVERWRERTFEEIISLARAECDRVQDITDWYYFGNGLSYGEIRFRNEEEALASISDMPDLVDAARRRDNVDFYNTMSVYYDAAEEIKEYAEYLAGYGEYLAGIQSQSEIQSQTAVFGKPRSFARSNLAKTAEDFAKMLDTRVEFGNNRGIERWLGFELGDYFHLAAITVIVMSFLDERRRGLWPVIRTTRGGRGRLGLTRIGILFFGSLLATALYSFLPFAVSMCLHGGWSGLGRPLQSVESFGTCPLKISIAEWLVQFFAVKLLSGVLIGLLLWSILGSIANPQFSIAVLGVTLAAEYALYEYLPVQSFLNILKYFNIFSYVHTATLYTEYLNVNLFGSPVGIRTLALWGIMAFGIGLAAWVLTIQIKRRPEGNRDHLSRISLPVNMALDSVRIRFTAGSWEGYKSLVFQYGILLLALAFIIGGELTFINSAEEPVDTWYVSYMSDLECPIDDSIDAYLAKARANAKSSKNAAACLDALDRVEARLEELRLRAEEGGYEPWAAREFYYDVCYGPQSKNTQRLNAAIAILLASVLTCTLWPFERQSGVIPMLRSTLGGRRRLLRRKSLTAALLAAIVWACVYMRELWSFLNIYPRPETLPASIYNFDSLTSFPIDIPVWQFMALIYAMRLVMLIAVAETALSLGFLCANTRTALLAGAALLGIPALLTSLGAEMFKWVSPVVPVASAELMWGMGGGSYMYLLPWLAWLSATTAAMLVMRKKWIRG